MNCAHNPAFGYFSSSPLGFYNANIPPLLTVPLFLVNLSEFRFTELIRQGDEMESFVFFFRIWFARNTFQYCFLICFCQQFYKGSILATGNVEWSLAVSHCLPRPLLCLGKGAVRGKCR